MWSSAKSPLCRAGSITSKARLIRTEFQVGLLDSSTMLHRPRISPDPLSSRLLPALKPRITADHLPIQAVSHPSSTEFSLFSRKQICAKVADQRRDRCGGSPARSMTKRVSAFGRRPQTPLKLTTFSHLASGRSALGTHLTRSWARASSSTQTRGFDRLRIHGIPGVAARYLQPGRVGTTPDPDRLE